VTSPVAPSRLDPAEDRVSLHRSEERLRLVLEATGAAIWDAQAETGETYLSPSFEAILGVTTGDAPRSVRALLRHVVPEHRAHVVARMREALRQQRPFALDCRVGDPRGRTRWLHIRGDVVRDDSGRIIRSIGTVVDITDAATAAAARVEEERAQSRAEVRRAELQAQREAEMHHAQKLESLGLLAGGIAHDFNNLLVGVLANASLALLDLDERSPARHVVLDIERTAQRAADLTRQLLAYSGKGRFIVEPLDLSALAREMSQLLRTVVSKDAVLHLELQEPLPSIEGDATQLRQVIMNLITNASDALEGGTGTITVRTVIGDAPPLGADVLTFGDLGDATDTVSLEVIDTGVGMTRDVAERIFDPFFSTKFTGRGLGLAAALGIVRGHRGRITVETTRGRGTRLRLTFPALSPIDAADAPSPMAVAPVRRKGRVLVVDDDAVVRTVTTALLERQGFEVEAVDSGQAALDRLAAGGPTLRFVLLDLTMPGLSGVQVLEQLRAHERSTGMSPQTVVLMSGYSERDVTRNLGSLAIAGFLQKPFTLADLHALLDRLPDA
jgi:PAS domain S-box-containing protein